MVTGNNLAATSTFRDYSQILEELVWIQNGGQIEGHNASHISQVLSAGYWVETLITYLHKRVVIMVLFYTSRQHSLHDFFLWKSDMASFFHFSQE